MVNDQDADDLAALQRDLEELAQQDPIVRAASESVDSVTSSILDRARRQALQCCALCGQPLLDDNCPSVCECRRPGPAECAP